MHSNLSVCAAAYVESDLGAEWWTLLDELLQELGRLARVERWRNAEGQLHSRILAQHRASLHVSQNEWKMQKKKKKPQRLISLNHANHLPQSKEASHPRQSRRVSGATCG